MTTDTTTRTVGSPRPGTCAVNYDHRLDGPVRIDVCPHDEDGHLTIEWYDHGRQHRLDGPAYIRSDGDIFWDVNDNPIAYLLEHISRDRP